MYFIINQFSFILVAVFLLVFATIISRQILDFKIALVFILIVTSSLIFAQIFLKTKTSQILKPASFLQLLLSDSSVLQLQLKIWEPQCSFSALLASSSSQPDVKLCISFHFFHLESLPLSELSPQVHFA